MADYIKTKKLIGELIDSWLDFYSKPEYYLTIHIPAIISNPSKRTMREDLLLTCLGKDQNIGLLVQKYIQDKEDENITSNTLALLDAYDFSKADQLFEKFKARMPWYVEKRIQAEQQYVAQTRNAIIDLLKDYQFLDAERLYSKISSFFEREEYEQYVTKYKEIQTTEITVNTIEKLLQSWKFIEARLLYDQNSAYYPKRKFEQKFIEYQIRYEFSQNNFIAADSLFANCPPEFADTFRKLKRDAIQHYFSKQNIAVTQEQALVLANSSKAVLIKARAGSGKTRVLASKTAMLIDRYKINPDNILILAFNKRAAREIGSRIQKNYKIESYENARTFHSLAFQLAKFKGDILFNNQGEFSKPALSNFVRDILRQIWSPQIQENLYLLFRKEMHSLEQTGGLLSNADYLAFIRNKRDISLNGDRVKSLGEKYIADYLFEHDIPFFYERVEFWSGHCYRPDFSLFPETGQIIIEFWGIDENDPRKSVPPSWGITWENYRAEMEEKRAYWKEKEIPLIEMSVSDVRLGRDLFEKVLKEKLEKVGIKKERLPQKDLEKKVIRNQKDRMTDLFVQFIQRTKKQMWSVEQVQNKVREYKTNDERTKLFLNLGCQLYSAYQKKLDEINSIDFDDLTVKASKIVRDSQGTCTLDLGHHKDRHIKMKDIKWILIDEFQDFSDEFYFLLQSILDQNPDVNLICVGDNWQAINGFAGSDITYFSRFSSFFKNSTTEYLLTNHRSKKAIVDFSNKIMLGRGEPATSALDNLGGEVIIQTIDEIWIESREGNSYENERDFDQRFIFYEERQYGRIINDNGFLHAKYLKACYQIIKEPDNWNLILRNKTDKPVIAILSRTNYLYRVSLDEFIEKLKSCFTPQELISIGDFNQKIRINTAHGFKGLEAEIVIILRVCDGSFPLLHPDNGLFEFFGQSEYQVLEEERRLFYVAASRPSKALYILTEKGNESSFL